MGAMQAPACNCCGDHAWEYAFTERGVDLGRCRTCGLYYVAQMPTDEERIAEVAEGRFAEDQHVASAEVHLEEEQVRIEELKAYVATAQTYAPTGTWLDVGCGTGTLIALASDAGVECEGLELTRKRRDLARRVTGAKIHEEPLEQLALAGDSYAAILLIYVFSHLTDPARTLREIHRILKPGGILLMKTGEVGPGASQEHAFDWNLGDHLFILGEDTIERYAAKTGFEVVHRTKVWQPTEVYSESHFRARGRSRLRNAVKSAVLHTPGAMRLVTTIMLARHKGNPLYSSTLVLRKNANRSTIEQVMMS